MNNLTDTALRQEGMRVLLKNLGKVDAERFVALIAREPFDYTEWQQGLFPDLSFDELNDEAMRFFNQQNTKNS